MKTGTHKHVQRDLSCSCALYAYVADDVPTGDADITRRASIGANAVAQGLYLLVGELGSGGAKDEERCLLQFAVCELILIDGDLEDSFQPPRQLLEACPWVVRLPLAHIKDDGFLRYTATSSWCHSVIGVQASLF